MPVHRHILLNFLIFVACKDTAWKLTELYVKLEPLDVPFRNQVLKNNWYHGQMKLQS